jgi:hypothetical protein
VTQPALTGHDTSLTLQLANSIGRSNTLHKTYAPLDIEAVRNIDAARLRGRYLMRAENKSREKGLKKATERRLKFQAREC